MGGGALATVHRLPPGARSTLASALHPAFLTAAIVAIGVWIVAVVGVKEVPLRRSLEEDVVAVGGPAGSPGE